MNGKVLVAYGPGNPLGIAELYDPASGIFTAAENTTTPYYRTGHTATLLSDGNVLLAGGCSCEVIGEILFFADAEIYDPAKGTFVSTGSMQAIRWDHTATLLNDGRVLIAGGASFVGTVAPDRLSGEGRTEELSSAELYHPAAVQGTPTVQIVDNNTGSLTTLVVGDAFSFLVTGAPPSSLVSVSEAGWSASVGYTDSSGSFRLSGTVAASVVGTWQQTWTIGGVVAQPSPLQFTIPPKP